MIPGQPKRRCAHLSTVAVLARIFAATSEALPSVALEKHKTKLSRVSARNCMSCVTSIFCRLSKTTASLVRTCAPRERTSLGPPNRTRLA
eukprot:1010413-Pyramimonas_sp.AAC.1